MAKVYWRLEFTKAPNMDAKLHFYIARSYNIAIYVLAEVFRLIVYDIISKGLMFIINS